MSDRISANGLGAASPDAGLAFAAAVKNCLQRVRSWQVPPNWALSQWFEEIEAHALAAACDAEAAYDPARSVPFGAFIYSRVMARVLTHYRQEWSYARRVVGNLAEGGEEVFGCAAPSQLDHRDLDEAVDALSTAQRWLLEQIFWRESTESSVASVLGLSQRAVSKRKQAVLRLLRRSLEDRKKNEIAVLNGGPRGN